MLAARYDTPKSVWDVFRLEWNSWNVDGNENYDGEKLPKNQPTHNNSAKLKSFQAYDRNTTKVNSIATKKGVFANISTASTTL